MLAGLDPLVILYMLCDGTQDDLLHQLPQYREQLCWILHLGWCNPGCTYRLGDKMLECSPAERDVGVSVDGKPSMSHQYVLVAKRANCILGALSTVYLTSQKKLLSHYTQLHLEYCVQFRALQYRKDIKILEYIQKRTTKVVKG
ncbi:hypothetical protein QYF61_006023 [Mycteria americana]|uniref:Uncharacterized protein n=1 Tax=Mycteria americana TaxID=33587 RepID=A0AAN7RWT4_MYCAM|nr:hypothetical protein QYF61_006023 [Mycteria americana]